MTLMKAWSVRVERLYSNDFRFVGCGERSPERAPRPAPVRVEPPGGPGPVDLYHQRQLRLVDHVEKGMHDGAKEFGAQVEMRRCEGEPAQQIQRIEDVLSLPDVQGVAISVLEAESPGIADKMKELQKAGKVVIAIDSDGQKDARRAYIGTFNRKAGEVAGKVARMLRPQEARPSPSSGRPPRRTPANADGFF